MSNVKGYEIEYEYEGNALIVHAPDGHTFSMNCEGLDEEGIKKSVKNSSFYPEHKLKNLLDKNINYETAYAEVKKMDESYKKMKRVLTAEA